MRRLQSRLTLLVLIAGLSSPFGWGQDDQDRDQEYRLELDLGYRWEAMFRGSRDLYRTQLDLGEGPKLFSADLFFAPKSGSDQLFDRLQMQLGSWGGEPYNTARIRMGKRGLYELDFNYQNIHYFSSIPSFANPLLGQGSLSSQHREDTSLRTAGLEMRFAPGSTIQPFFGYQRTTRFGPVRTTLSADGDEFVVDKNLDFSSDDLRGGLVLQFSRASLRVEQGARWYRDLSTWNATGFQEGNSSRPFVGQPIFLDRFDAEQDVKSRAIPYTNVVANLRASETVSVQGSMTYSISDFRTSYLESLAGNFYSFPELRAAYTAAERDASGVSKRPSIRADLVAQWQPVSWFRLVDRFRTHRRHVSGFRLLQVTYFNVDRSLVPGILDRLDTEGRLDTWLAADLDRNQIEGQVFPDRRLMLRAGYRYEKQELQLEERYETTRDILILGGSYRLSGANRFGVDYERGRSDSSIFRRDVRDFDRLKVNGRLTPVSWLEFDGSASLFDHQDDLVDFDAENRVYSLQFTLRPMDRVAVVGQWERSEIDTTIPFIAPQTFTTETSLYRELGNYGNLLIDLRLIRNSRLSLGYSVWGTSGDFPVTYHQPVARFEVPLCERVLAYGQWNYYDYNEKLTFFPQDYRAHLATFGFRYIMGQ